MNKTIGLFAFWFVAGSGLAQTPVISTPVVSSFNHSGLEGDRPKPKTQDECITEKKVEANQVISHFGIYKIQGLEGVLLYVCQTSGGLLTYQFKFPEGQKEFGIDDTSHLWPLGKEYLASKIDAAKPWGILYGDDDLWVYSESNGCFYWHRAENGKFTCESMPFDGPTDKDSFASFSFHGQFKKISETLHDKGATNWEDLKGTFRPYSQDFPQIIQASDYPSIESIEALYDLLNKVGKDEKTTLQLLDGSLQFGSDRVGMVTLTPGQVSIGEKKFKNNEVWVLFTTLKKVLDAVSKTSPCHEVQFTQFGTGAYHFRTVIEFGCQPHVVTLESDSNGPDDEERLYILDLVKDDDEGLLMNFKK
jgi:hypothetical protein